MVTNGWVMLSWSLVSFADFAVAQPIHPHAPQVRSKCPTPHDIWRPALTNMGRHRATQFAPWIWSAIFRFLNPPTKLNREKLWQGQNKLFFVTCFSDIWYCTEPNENLQSRCRKYQMDPNERWRKPYMSFSYNLTCLPHGLPRCFRHHSFSFRGWLVSWFCFRGASAKASSSWNLQIDLALMEIDWLWLWRIVGDVWFVCANICMYTYIKYIYI